MVTSDGQGMKLTTSKAFSGSVIQDPQPMPITTAVTHGIYVGSFKSDKYHNPDCRHAENISPENKIWYNSKSEDLTAGYVPCGVCKP